MPQTAPPKAEINISVCSNQPIANIPANPAAKLVIALSTRSYISCLAFTHLLDDFTSLSSSLTLLTTPFCIENNKTPPKNYTYILSSHHASHRTLPLQSRHLQGRRRRTPRYRLRPLRRLPAPDRLNLLYAEYPFFGKHHVQSFIIRFVTYGQNNLLTQISGQLSSPSSPKPR